MSRWWRAYSESMHDPKLMLLPAEMFRAWYVLLCVASENDGQIPSSAHAALALRLNDSKAKATVAFLAGKGLFDAVPGGYFSPHNWSGRQYKRDVSTDRVKRFRNRHRNDDETVSSTQMKRHQIQNTDTEVEGKKETRASALAFGWPADFREKFWEAYPNKVGKADAIRKLEKIVKSGQIGFDAMMVALFRYANKTDDRPFCNPATWLHQERWTDEPAVENGVKNGQPSRPRGALDAARDYQRHFESGADSAADSGASISISPGRLLGP